MICGGSLSDISGKNLDGTNQDVETQALEVKTFELNPNVLPMQQQFVASILLPFMFCLLRGVHENETASSFG